MNSIQTIQDVLLEAQRQARFTGVPRRLAYRLVPGKAFVCIGARRSGKSTLLNQMIAKLLDQGHRRGPARTASPAARQQGVRRGRSRLA